MNLYEIATEYKLLSDTLLNSEIDEQTKIDTLESIGGDLETKVSNIAYLIRQFEADEKMAMEESKRISELAKTRKNAATRLREWLTVGLQQSGREELSFPAFTVKLKKNPHSVVINNPELLSDEYKRTKIEIEPDKVKICSDLKSGISVAGAHLEQKQTVVIK